VLKNTFAFNAEQQQWETVSDIPTLRVRNMNYM